MNTLILNLWGESQVLGQKAGSAREPLESLVQAHQTELPVVISDWSPDTLVGVDTLLAKPAAAGALIERKLRDQGETDGVCKVLVHRSRTLPDGVDIAYSAIPLKAWRETLQSTEERSRAVLVMDWHRVLIDSLAAATKRCGALLALGPRGLDVVVMDHGRVVALQRWPVMETEAGPDWLSIGHRVRALANEVLPEGAEVDWRLWTVDGGEPAAAELRKAWDGEGLRVEAVSPALLLPVVSLFTAVNPWPTRLARAADMTWPVAGVLACVVSLALALASAVIHTRNTATASALPSADERREVWQTLNKTVNEADALAKTQAPLKEWITLRQSGGLLPDLSTFLGQLRSAAGQQVAIDEVGLVADGKTHLITVIGRTSGVEDSLRGENAFVQAMQSHGYSVQRRDVLLEQGQPRFKLSMTWSSP